MKNLLFIALLSLSLMVQGQERKGQQYQKDFTPEQMATIKTKKMALHLDLSQEQQNQLLKVNRSWAEKRAQDREKFKAQMEGEEKPDADERYAMKVQMLDNQLAYQGEVKKILTQEQYVLWKEHRAKGGDHGRPGQMCGQKRGPNPERGKKRNR